MTNSKYIMDVFNKRLLERFKNHCRIGTEELTIEHFITYLIDNDLISDASIRHFVVNTEFCSVPVAPNQNKTTKVQQLAKKFNISERSIWSILKTRKF